MNFLLAIEAAKDILYQLDLKGSNYILKRNSQEQGQKRSHSLSYGEYFQRRD